MSNLPPFVFLPAIPSIANLVVPSARWRLGWGRVEWELRGQAVNKGYLRYLRLTQSLWLAH